MTAQTEYALFRLNGQGCAIALETVIQVNPYKHCCAIPLSPVWLAGLIEVFGQAVPLIDLGLFSSGMELPAAHQTVLVVQPEKTLKRWFALRIDAAPVICSEDAFLSADPVEVSEPLTAWLEQHVEYAGQSIAVLAPLKIATWSRLS